MKILVAEKEISLSNTLAEKLKNNGYIVDVIYDGLDGMDSTRTREETIDAVNDAAMRYMNQGYYYLYGSPNFIESISNQLKANNIDARNIIHDSFKGY